MKKRKYLLLLGIAVFLVGCSSLESFNKGLENLNQKLAGVTNSKSTKQIRNTIKPNVATKGKGKFENLKIEFGRIDGGSRESDYEFARIYGFYTNTSKKTQTIEIVFDLKDINGTRIRSNTRDRTKSFIFMDIRPGEKIDLSKEIMNEIETNPGEFFIDNSMQFIYK